MADARPPMEEQTTPEEEEDEECLYPGFATAHGFSASGEGASTILGILRNMPEAKYKTIYSSLSPGGSNKKKAAALMKLLDTDKALERDILAHRQKAIKKWNKEHRAEENAAADIIDDSLPIFGVGKQYADLAAILRERPDLAAAARKRFGEELNAQALAKLLRKSEEAADVAICDAAWAHRDKRWAAYRAKESSQGRLRSLDNGVRVAVSAEAQTRKAVAVNWSDTVGKGAAATLKKALDLLEYTPTYGDAEWDAITATVSRTAGRTYTTEQCYGRACTQGLLRPKVPAVWTYQPDSPHWRPRKPPLEGLDPSLQRGEYARSDLEQLSPDELYYLATNVYNHDIWLIRHDKKALIEVLIESNMPAVDPRKHGAKAFERANSRAFRRVMRAEVLGRLNVAKSWEATRQRLEGPENARPHDGQNEVSRTVAASRIRLFASKAVLEYRAKFAPGPGEDPPTKEMPVLVGHFTAAPYAPHDVYDAAQDCAICLRLYEDTGNKVFCEHAWDVINELVAIRENGACRDRRT